MLTHEQARLLSFLQERRDAGDLCPTFTEMASSLGIKSKSGVFHILQSLEERGFIRRLPHRARAIEILKPVPNAIDYRGLLARAVAMLRAERVPDDAIMRELGVSLAAFKLITSETVQ